jgi:hypothetical protein
VCRTDLHLVDGELPLPHVPLVPGHEIVGRVTAVGSEVSRYKVGDAVAVGCMVDSCQHCDQCRKGEEQLCRNGNTQTYNDKDRITGERKHRDPFAFRSYAKLLFSANSIPRSSDRSYAYHRRWIIIPFSRVFDGQGNNPAPDLTLRQKLLVRITDRDKRRPCTSTSGSALATNRAGSTCATTASSGRPTSSTFAAS